MFKIIVIELQNLFVLQNLHLNTHKIKTVEMQLSQFLFPTFHFVKKFNRFVKFVLFTRLQIHKQIYNSYNYEN